MGIWIFRAKKTITEFMVAWTLVRNVIVIFCFPVLSSAGFNYFDPTHPTNAPALLSQTGIYSNIVGKVTDTAAKYFEVNAPLWSDGALKKRWVILKPGKHITYDDTTDFFNYPDSTVFVKSFSMVRAPGDTIYVETRLLIKKQGEGSSPTDWYGYSYRWNATQTDANLVSPSNGYDTVFFTTDSHGRRSYKKWRFPSQGNCNSCHIGRGSLGKGGKMNYGRGVLGFFPAQLKRPLFQAPALDQVIDLFNKGIFTGTRPSVPELARRFKGVLEPLPATLTAGHRAAAIDTMARSYIAANCSGCHGSRGNNLALTGEVLLNYDFHSLKSQMQFGMRSVANRGLFDTVSYDTNLTTNPKGRAYYRMALDKWGFSSASGVWDMTLPNVTKTVLVYPGYPSASTILFRQWARKSPWTDSGAVSRALKFDLQFGDPPVKAQAQQRRTWFFAQPWGSQGWQDTLAKHGLPMDSIISLINQTYGFYSADDNQMPPLASFQPDTSALKILGEWVKGYQESFVALAQGGFTAGQTFAQAFVRNRTLVIPKEWRGLVQMMDIQGRTYNLERIDRETYALPSGLPRGYYCFKIGTCLFRATVL